MDQIILACDDEGNFQEYISKQVGHTGKGRRHLAITVLLHRRKSTRSPYNSMGEVLLQKRKHKVFDNIWDFTASTHPLHLEEGSNETLEEAALRALKDEYGIGEVRELREVGSFNYFAKIDGLCENEHCAMMVGEYDGKVNMDPEIGYEYKWMVKEDFLKDIEENPQNYTPWVIEGVKVLKQKGFFN